MERRALATSVAEVESRIVPELAVREGQPGERRERNFALRLVSALTLFSVAIDGYHPYADDGGLYMAGVKRLLDPALYPHATAFVLEPMRFSLFAPTVAAVVRHLPLAPDSALHHGLPYVLLALHLVSVWATLFAAWMLASRCLPDRVARAGAVFLLACWLVLPVAGTALQLMDVYATARSFSTPAMVLALVGVLDMTAHGPLRIEEKKWHGLLLWAGSIALASAMHPLMAAYALGATLMLFCARSPNRAVRLWGSVALAAAALIVAAGLQTFAMSESVQYLRAVLTRTYWFPVEWRWYELLGLAAPLILLAVEATLNTTLSKPQCKLTTEGTQTIEADNARRALAYMAVATGATALLVAILFARTSLTTHLVARMQPLRAFQVVYLILFLLLGARLGERVMQHSAWRWGVAMLLLGGAMLTTARIEFPNSNHLELPGLVPSNRWEKAFLWIRDNTPKDALFALDADYINAPGEDAQCFRAVAERSTLPDYSKDGGEASIAPQLAVDWSIGQAALQGLSAEGRTDAERLSTLRPLGVDWVVLRAAAATSLDCPYTNSAVMVCRLR